MLLVSYAREDARWALHLGPIAEIPPSNEALEPWLLASLGHFAIEEPGLFEELSK